MIDNTTRIMNLTPGNLPADVVRSSRDELLAQVLDRYLVSLESGTPLDLERLVAEYPHLSKDIRTFAESLEVLHSATSNFRSDQPTTSDEQVAAKRLGDFEIGPEIGRGGMGVVYEARQISLDRKVALKVLPFAAVWDQKQIARFRNEAQAAAQLQHPNIVPVFAVGEQRGVHFYAMQFIAGQSLDEAVRELRRESNQSGATSNPPQASGETVLAATTDCAPQPTSTFSQQYSAGRNTYCRAVAKLGVQAAQALHHAHEYGIVHRDIKPSNLMVDHQGKLWITDFGLARVQNSPGVTVTGDVVGTLRYMSPEQAAGEHALVDIRTDIYGLGATLYELSTLQPAFPGEDRHQVMRAVETQEPVAPRSINSDIPVDLETIILQAMAKSRDGRYDTAEALAEDLTRFLEGKPTLARRPTLIDRATKWFHRHRLAAAASVLVLVLLATLSTVGAILLAREKAEKESALAQAQQNLQQSNENFRKARQVVDRFGIQLADQLQDTPGTERIRQQLLLETLNYYQGFLEQVGADGTFRDQLAMTHLKAGVVSGKLGATGKAIDEYQIAQQILEQSIVDDPEDPQLKSHLAMSRNNLALLLAAQGQTEEALAEYEQAIESQRHLVATHPGEEAFAGQLAESHVNRGTLLGQIGQTDEAVQSLTHAVTILHETSAAAPDDPRQARNLAIAYNNLSFVQRRYDADLAEKSALRSVKILQRFAELPDASDECRADLALCYSNLAAIQNGVGSSDEAIGSYQAAISLRESLLRKSPNVVRYRSELAASLNNLALLDIERGDVSAAAEAFDYANRLFAALLADYPDQIAFASGWAALLNNQALALVKIERYEDAIEAYRQAVAVQQRVVEHLGNSLELRMTLSRMKFNYGQALQATAQFEEATELALTRRQLWQGNGERLFGVAIELAQILQKSGQSNESADHSALDSLRSSIVATLQESLEAGYRPQNDLAVDPRFENLRNEPGFRDAISSSKSNSKSHDSPTERRVDL